MAHGKPLCLLGKWPYAATHQSWSHSSPSRHPRHTASVPPQSPSKLEKSEIAAEREEKKMEKDSKTLRALCARLPSGTRATAHIVRCQSLSNIGHPSNPIQWQCGGLTAIHATYIIRHCPLPPGPKRWLLSQRFLCSTKAYFAGLHLHKGREIRIYSLH